VELRIEGSAEANPRVDETAMFMSMSTVYQPRHAMPVAAWALEAQLAIILEETLMLPSPLQSPKWMAGKYGLASIVQFCAKISHITKVIE